MPELNSERITQFAVRWGDQFLLALLADNSVNIKVRAWSASANDWDVYWDVFFDMQEAVKTRFDAVGLEIPFPQRDVHLHTVKD